MEGNADMEQGLLDDIKEADLLQPNQVKGNINQSTRLYDSYDGEQERQLDQDEVTEETTLERKMIKRTGSLMSDIDSKDAVRKRLLKQ